MKTKQKLMLTVLLLGVVLGRDAHAFYNPGTGRWLNRDPIEERGGKNLHSIAANDAINKFDKLGRKCCLLTWNTTFGSGSAWGHSALKCDNGVYISAFPSIDGIGSEVVTSPVEWHNEATDLAEGGNPDSTVCSDCIDESKVAAWVAPIRDLPPDYKGVTSNCADYTMQAIAAGLDPDKQAEPQCPACSWGLSWVVTDLMDSGIPPTTQHQVANRLKDLTANGCNRYKCVPKPTRLGGGL